LGEPVEFTTADIVLEIGCTSHKCDVV